MDYKEKYKQALERAREQYNKRTPLYDIGSIFPELKESEDERIRKKLICFVENWKKFNPNSPFDDYAVYTSDSGECDKILAWLEKQGEQKQTWKPSAAQLIVIKSLIEDKNTSKVDKVVLRGMFDEFKQICDAKNEIEKQCND